MSKWADELEQLPTLSVAQSCDLKVERYTASDSLFPSDSLRVWLSRCTTDDGEPFDRTVYVEILRDGVWTDVGYFDGDEDDPRPTGLLGEAWQATYEALADDA